MTHSTAPIRNRARAAFSLVEVLLAIFILALGIISIAALFPAGIAQQRLANDDFMGPVVANHALSVIRSKISADDFGTFEEFAQVGGFYNNAPQAYYSRTIPGDWGWLRPSVIWPDDAMGGAMPHLNGALDIFSFWRVRQDYLGLPSFLSFETTSEFFDPIAGSDGWPEQDVWTAIGTGGDPPPLHGLPFNLDKHYLALPIADQTSPPLPPQRIITQAERYYPMQTNLASSDRPRKPEYVWDCMFRRFQGRIYVAVFVYRVATPQSGDVLYTVPRHPVNAQLPLLPFKLDLRDANASGAVWSSVWYDIPPDNLRGPWDVQYDQDPDSPRPVPFVYGTQAGTPLDLADPRQAWQENRQWFVDQNNNVYRVLGSSRTTFDELEESIDNPVRVELSRPLQPVRVSYFGSDTVNPPADPFAPPFEDLPLPTESPYEYYADVFNDVEAYPDPASLPQPFFNNTNSFDRGVVTDIHYIPLELEDADGNVIRLTPVYATVKEL